MAGQGRRGAAVPWERCSNIVRATGGGGRRNGPGSATSGVLRSMGSGTRASRIRVPPRRGSAPVVEGGRRVLEPGPSGTGGRIGRSPARPSAPVGRKFHCDTEC
jgi:hypothetical protein